jgi:alpha-mannosidase
MNTFRHGLGLVLIFVLPACAALGADNAEISLVPFSHLDLFWGGTREECLARGNALVARAVRQAKSSPQFRFLLEDEVFVDHFLATHRGSPAVDELKQLVKSGQIEIGAKWAAIYQDLGDGELQARNLMIGKRYAQSVFGVEPQVAHLGDLPGYTPQFPQLLAQAKVPFMVMTRMGPSDKSLFSWKSPDGSKALVWSSLKSYAWGAGLRIHEGTPSVKGRERFEKSVADVRATTDGPILMHLGSDLWTPPENLQEKVAEFNAATGARLVLSTPGEYFRRAQQTASIPELAGEIPSSWPNLITSMPHMWPPLVSAANTLLAAEKFAAINHALQLADYPQGEFDAVWRRLLESADHNQDGQGGTFGDIRKIEHQQMAVVQGGQILRDMLANIAERVEIPHKDSFPLVVFNPMGWSRDDVVRTRLAIYGDPGPHEIAAFKKGMRLLDEAGQSVPFHVEQYSENISRTLDLVFVARGVPSLGYKTYYMVAAEPSQFPPAATVKLDDEKDLREPRRPLGVDTLENTFYRLSVDRATGRVALFDKALARDVCADMEVTALEERGGNYIGIEPPTRRTLIALVEGVTLEENNAVRAVVRVDLRIADITIAQRLTLYRGLKRLDIENAVDWRGPRFIRIRQMFPLADANAAIHYGIPFGANVAENIMPNVGPHLGDEITPESWRQCRFIQGWIHAGSADAGLTVACDHPLVRLEPGAITGEMIRGTRFTSAKVVRGEQVGSMHYPPPGRYVFRYSLSSGTGDWRASKAYRAGLGFNNPLLPVEVADAVSAKSLPPTHSFCTLKADNLVVSSLKKADLGPGVLLRVYEIEGAAANTPVEFLGQQAAFHETNILEQNVDPATQQTLHVGPYKIKTIQLGLEKP